MNMERLLCELSARAVQLRRSGNGLSIRSNAEVDAALVAQLSAHKSTLLELLLDGGDWWCPPPAITPEMLPLVDLTREEIDSIVGAVPGAAANVQDIYPLAPLQEGILFHHLLGGDGDPYLLSCSFRFDSRARLDAYLAALQSVIDRHDILRTAFAWELLKSPVQVVWRRAPLPIEELTATNAGELRDRFDPRRHRIDVRTAPLLRAQVARDAADGSWMMLLLSHHLVNDHTTLEILQSEVRAHLEGRAAELPAPLPFRNFVAHVRLGASMAEHEEFFRTMLGDVDEPTAPFGLVQVQGDGSGVEEAHLDLDDDLSARLRVHARRLGVTPAGLFHLAWALVLAHASGRDDVVFGTVLFGRMNSGEGADRVLGLFMNTLPLRVRVGEEDVETSVRRTHAALAGLLGHEHASLALAQRCSGVPSPAPLFSALLNYRHNARAVAEPRDESPGIESEYGQERTNFPLVLTVDDLGDSFTLTAQVQAPVGAARVCELVRTAVERLLAALERPPASLRTIDVLPEGERRRLLEEWNDTGADVPEVCIHELFEAQVERTPDAIAVVDETRTLTYRALNEEANRLAHALRADGVVPDACVAVRMERSVDMVVTLLAVLKAGGAYVPLDPSYPEERLQQMLADSGAVVVLDGQRATGQFPPANPSRGNTPRNLAYVIYTSGSTGVPKGVMNEHRGVVNRLLWMQQAYPLTANDAVLQKTPYSFDVSVWELFWTLAVGARLVMARPDGHKDPAYLSEVIARERITTLHFVPSMLQTFLQYGALAKCTSLKRVVCSGEALSAALVARFHELLPHVALSNLYGPTEAAVDVTAWECRRGDVRASIPIGRPIANTRIYILDSHGQPAPVGVAGELHIGGVQVARGYLHRPELTNEKFVRDPFSSEPDARMYRTGDLARWLPEGVIEYLGRNDFQVKLRGFRIELGEIEARLIEHSLVREAVVLAHEQRLAAYIVAPREIDIDELRRSLGTTLPEHMVPSAYVRLDALPLTSSGKLDRKALPAPDGDAYGTRTDEPPQGEVETLIARIWSELLGIERVGRHDNFFQLGGHSLLAVSLMERMRRESLAVDVRAVFTTPTLAALAAGVRREDDYGPLVVLRSAHRAEAPLICVPGAGANVASFAALADAIGDSRPVYGLQPRGLDGTSLPHSTVEAAAHVYLEAIDEVQPEGPLHLMGHSFGGWVVFEMAQRLRSAGRPVASLTIVDSDVPAGPDTTKEYDDVAATMSLVEVFEQRAERSLEIRAADLQARDETQRRVLLHQRLVTVGILPERSKPEVLRGPMRVFARCLRTHYTPAAGYDGPVRLVVLKDARLDDEANRLQHEQCVAGWKRWAPDSTVWHGPGNHMTAFDPPHVQVVAEWLRSHL